MSAATIFTATYAARRALKHTGSTPVSERPDETKTNVKPERKSLVSRIRAAFRKEKAREL